jgi:hypothetical protein
MRSPCPGIPGVVPRLRKPLYIHQRLRADQLSSLASSWQSPHSFDIINPIAEGIDDLDVLDIRDSVPGIAETFHVVLKTLIMLLADGLQGLCCRWTLVRALEVPNEYGTQLVL